MERLFMGALVIGFLSEIGHNNFHYPSHTKVCVNKQDIMSGILELQWLANNNRDLRPYKIKRSLIKPLTIDDQYVNIVVNSGNEFIVVWFKKGEINDIC
tara:strand:+ start:11067 stop:11363 length:297 start_codon:yes stop_codon:yes gene_type:complete